MNQKPLTITLLVCLLILTVWIRLQGVDRLPDGQFTENDAYLLHRHAQTIAEQGALPARDLHRWLPLGRENGQLLSLYAYAIAYTHKVFPWWSLYQIQLYLPVLCWTLGLGVLFLFLTRCYGLFFATIVGVLLATLPGSIERSAAGFGDRDAWCWMLGVLAVTCYLWKDGLEPGRRRWLATALSGFIVFLGGLSWEAFGVFVLMIVTIELWKFCTTEPEQHLKEYLVWVLMFVPGLYLISPAYRSGYGFTTHVAALMLFPPLTVYALRGLRCLILKYYPPMQSHSRKLACGLTLIGIAAGAGYMVLQHGTFAETAFTLFETPLMKNVGELADPHFRFWYRRYGALFLLGSLGLIIASLLLWKQNALPLTCALALFTATTFFRGPLSDGIGAETCNALFLVSLGVTVLFWGIAGLRTEAPENERVTLAMLAWFLLWVGLARGGKRYDFFIGIPLAYGTAWLLYFSPGYIIHWLKSTHRLPPHLKESSVTALIAIAVLIPVLFLNPLGGHLNRAGYAAAEMRTPTPGRGTPLAQTLTWMKQTLPESTVVAANWSYGHLLNTFGGVKTITDPDHFLTHWIHLYYRHVFCAQSEREALEFLKTHGATHLMLTKRGVTKRAANYAALGSENNDRQFAYIRLLSLSNQRLSRTKQSPFLYIEAPDITSPPQFLSTYLKNGGRVKLPYLIDFGTHRTAYKTTEADTRYGGVLLAYSENDRFKNADYLAAVGWNSLALRLYQRGELSDIFVLVYPTNGDDDAEFKIWEIHYPPDIQADPKYLKTGFPERDEEFGLQ